MKTFLKDQSGATAIEYGLIASLVCISIIAGSNGIRTELAVIFSNVASQLAAAIAAN